MRIVDERGRPPEERIREILRRVKEALDTRSGPPMRDALRETTRRHFETIYPGSSHYDPRRVVDDYARGSSAAVEIDVPGVTRAYRNLDIRPVRAKRLAIPVHRAALAAKSPEDVPGLFYARNKKGTEMLARIEGGALVVMYILKDRVLQRQDPRLMPSDQTYADNIAARLAPLVKRAVASAP